MDRGIEKCVYSNFGDVGQVGVTMMIVREI